LYLNFHDVQKALIDAGEFYPFVLVRASDFRPLLVAPSSSSVESHLQIPRQQLRPQVCRSPLLAILGAVDARVAACCTTRASKILSSTLSHCFLQLLKKTSIIKRIIEEHDKAKPGSEGTKAAVQYLPYLYAVARAAQSSGELFPAVRIHSRRVLCDA